VQADHLRPIGVVEWQRTASRTASQGIEIIGFVKIEWPSAREIPAFRRFLDGEDDLAVRPAHGCIAQRCVRFIPRHC